MRNSQIMKCPACKSPLRGGIWFDAAELERVSARAAATLHTIWQVPVGKVNLTEPRPCPRCPDQVLERKWFSDLKKVEIDQCPKCGGVWLDAGEFSRIYDEVKGAKVSSPLWATAMAEAAALVKEKAE
jgi:Zn-finger nucleic acid-binding protein